MLDLKFIRENQALVKQALQDRNLKLDIEGIVRLDEQRRSYLTEVEALRSDKNKANDEIGALLKAKKDTKAKILSMKAISEKIDELEDTLSLIEKELEQK